MRLISGITHKAKAIAVHLRWRHLRGHGVHSPFVYSLIRNVFMKRGLPESGDRELFDLLRSKRTGRRWARQLQNLHSYCNTADTAAGNWLTAPVSTMKPDESLFDILFADGNSQLKEFAATASANRKATVILAPRADRERKAICRELISEKECLSVDNRGYIIFFYGFRLPSQHLKL